MARVLSNNISSWAECTDPNYPLLFVNRWIPFNAWYAKLVGKSQDRDCLNYLRVNPNNEIFDRIKELLTADKSKFDNMQFQHGFLELDRLLESMEFPSHNEILRFGNTEMTANTVYDASTIKDGKKYAIERYQDGNPLGRPPKSISVVIEDLRTHTNTTLNIAKHDIELLETQMSAKRLTSVDKKIVRTLFKKIEPTIHVDIKFTKEGFMKIGKNKFNSNQDALCVAIIEMLYELRCKAVHGEIAIEKNILPLYECAFNMLNLITKKFY